MGRGDMMYQRLAYAPKAHRARPKTKKIPATTDGDLYHPNSPLLWRGAGGEATSPTFSDSGPGALAP